MPMLKLQLTGNDDVASEGRLFGFYGSASGLPAAPSWIGDIDFPVAHLGYSVQGAGDVGPAAERAEAVGPHKRVVEACQLAPGPLLLRSRAPGGSTFQCRCASALPR